LVKKKIEEENNAVNSQTQKNNPTVPKFNKPMKR